MWRMMRLGWMCGIGGLLAACAAPSSHYYSLAGVPADAVASTPAAPTVPYGVQVQVLGIPAEADRPQLLVRDPAREPAVDVLNQSLWAAPLIDQVQAVLAARVSVELGAPDAQRLPGVADHPQRLMQVRVTRFDMVWNRGADLAAVWTDHKPGAQDPRICQAQVQVPAVPGVPALVEAQRQAVLILADLMAHDGASGQKGSPVSPIMIRAGCT